MENDAVQTILIVDDTPANLALVAHMLEDQGLRLVVAQGGAEALRRVALAPPDLILLDVMLPDIDGFEVCRRLKAGSAEVAQVPVIFMTALNGMTEKMTGFSVGAVDYLTKPLQVPEVLARISTHLQLSRMRTQLARQNALLRQENVQRRSAQLILQRYRDSLEQQVAARTVALRESERQFRTLSDNLPDPICRYDKCLALVYANPAHAQVVAGSDLPLMPATLQSVLDTGEPAEVTLYVRSPQGEVRYLALRAVAEYGPDDEVMGVLTIARDMTDQKCAEQELARSHAQLRDLGAYRDVGAEDERKNIARELHDELGQTLTALRMMVRLLPVRLGVQLPALSEHVQGMTELVDRTIGVVRGVVASLRPTALDLGIGSALGWLVEEFRKHDDAVCRLVVRLHDSAPCERQALALFRIAQESLTNISRHAAATEVQVLLRVRSGAWELQISDNGRGFDPAVSRTGSFGLLGMRERVLTFGGRVQLLSSPGQGTRVVVTIPVTDGAAEPGRQASLTPP